MKELGIALLRQVDKYKGSKRTWELTFLDTMLHEKQLISFQVETRHNLVGHEYTKENLYLLYRMGNDNKSDLELFVFDYAGMEKGHYEIRPELDFKLTYFVVAGKSVVLGGYVSKDPVVLMYDPATNHIKVLPGFFQKDNELVDLRVNQNQTFNAVVIDRSVRTEKKMVFKTFDPTGELLLEDVVNIDENKSLQTSITSSLEREELMVAGTYGSRQMKQSYGFYVVPIDPFADQKIHYIDFAQLKHYFDYIKPARAKRIRDNSARDIAGGRNPDYVDYVMPFKIEENKNGFVLLAEVYQPTTNSQYNPYMPTLYSGGGYPYGYYPYSGFYNPYMMYPYYYPGRFRPYYYGPNQKTMDDIKTTEAILLSFDAKGNVQWDQSLKITDVRRSSLDQVSDFYQKNDSIYVLHREKDDELRIKKMAVGSDVSKEVKQKIILANPLDEFRSERDDFGIRKWYGNSFYAWGYQTIRNINAEDRVRDVFYINKIVVR